MYYIYDFYSNILCIDISRSLIESSIEFQEQKGKTRIDLC